MAQRELVAHSLAEACLYLMVTPCPICGKGPLISGEATLLSPDGRLGTANVPARCRACNAANRWQFRISPGKAEAGAADEINAGDEPSQLIDLAQWITLSRIITEAASRSEDRVQARGFRIQAWQCLDEALKFFEPGNAIPPTAAFFAPESKQRFLDHPEQFERARLLQLRDRLPNQSPTIRDIG
jgi:hypothetical protein